MTIQPMGAGRPSAAPPQPGPVAAPPSGRVQFVLRDQVLNLLKSIQSGQGLLVVSPIGTGVPDDVLQMAMYTSPANARKGSNSYLINAVPGSNAYDVLDLNNLPNGIEVYIEVRHTATTPPTIQKSLFRGTEGNIQGASS